MKVKRLDDERFSLVAESAADGAFIDALHLNVTAAMVGKVVRPLDGRAVEIIGLEVDVGRRAWSSLVRDAQHKLARRFSEFLGLRPGELQDQLITRALASDPDPQVSVSPLGVKVEVMHGAAAGAVQAGQRGMDEVIGAHSDGLLVEADGQAPKAGADHSGVSNPLCSLRGGS